MSGGVGAGRSTLPATRLGVVTAMLFDSLKLALIAVRVRQLEYVTAGYRLPLRLADQLASDAVKRKLDVLRVNRFVFSGKRFSKVNAECAVARNSVMLGSPFSCHLSTMAVFACGEHAENTSAITTVETSGHIGPNHLLLNCSSLSFRCCGLYPKSRADT